MEEHIDEYICYTRFHEEDGNRWGAWEEGSSIHLTVILRYFSQPIRNRPLVINIPTEEGRFIRFSCEFIGRNDKISVIRRNWDMEPFEIFFCRRERTEETLAIHSRL